jgi:hypothetical protein
METVRRWLRLQAWEVCRWLCRGEAVTDAPEGTQIGLEWDDKECLPLVVVKEAPLRTQVFQAMANLDAIEKRQAEIARQQQADIANADHED